MQPEEKSLEAQIAERHLEIFGPESQERQEHRARIIARLRERGARCKGATAWKRRSADEQPPIGHQGNS